ncbi:MAG: helix-turn-helix domain-containing protein [Ramlibacter sp.]
MSKRTSPLLPATERRLHELGERIRLARLRRKLAAASVAERAGMSPMTLRGIERGGPGVTIGAYAAVLQVLGLEGDIDLVGARDETGRALQDSRLRAGAKLPATQPAAASPAVPRERGRPRRDASLTGSIGAEELAGLVAPSSQKYRRKL